MSITCIVCGDKYTKNERPIHMYQHQEAGELQNFPDLNGTFTKPSERDMHLHYQRLSGRKSRDKFRCIVCNYAFNSNRDKLAHMYKYLDTPDAEDFSPQLKKEIEESFYIRSLSKTKSRLKNEIKSVTPIQKKSTAKTQQKWLSKLAFFEAKLQLTATTIVEDEDEIEIMEVDEQDITQPVQRLPIALPKPTLGQRLPIPIPTLPVPELLGPFFN